MKQKYLILKNNEKKELIIREMAELGPETLSLLCEEIYDGRTIKSVIAQGKEVLIATLRTKNLFPQALYADKIAESVMNLYSTGNNQSISVELFFDDKEILIKTRDELEIEDDIKDGSDKLAGLDEN